MQGSGEGEGRGEGMGFSFGWRWLIEREGEGGIIYDYLYFLCFFEGGGERISARRKKPVESLFLLLVIYY